MPTGKPIRTELFVHICLKNHSHQMCECDNKSALVKENKEKEKAENVNCRDDAQVGRVG